MTARAYSDRGGAQLDVTIRNDGKNPVTLNYLLDDFTAKAGGATFACKKPLESYPNGALNPGGSQTISLHCADLDSATIESVNVIVDQRNATVALQKTAPPR